MRLVACHACRTQYDVAGATVARFACPCGAEVETAERTAVDAAIRRCAACGAGVETEARACAYCGAAIARERSHLGLVCPECYARNADASRYCTGCGVAFHPQPLPRPDEARACPVCTTDMAARTLAGTLVHQCSTCDGLWVRTAGFDALVDRTAAAARHAPAAGLGDRGAAPRAVDAAVVYRRCPACRQQMVRKNFGRTSGVIIDWCGQHGMWLDADELEHIARYVVAGGLERGREAAPGDATLDPIPSMLALERVLADERTRRTSGPHDLVEFLWNVFQTS
jgi:Zn-finger nucleic acid-binding protein